MRADFFRRYRLWLLLGLSALVRLLIAATTELGNDEVYYINYALYPDLSHFDHPPMVGWFIQLFSLNLLFSSELFIRLGAVVAGTINTWLIFLTGKAVDDELTGWYAALLYTVSFYTFVISGIFMMPDAPQTFFWLLTLLFVLKALPPGPGSRTAGNWLLLAGMAGGLAILSKYTSVFLFAGIGLYMLIFDRRWLRMWQTYAAVAIAAVLFLPVVVWNFRYDFVSFSFHSDRVEVVKTVLRPDLFAAELGGQIFYNNPFVFALVAAGLIVFFRSRIQEGKEQVRLLVAIALPVILLFLGFSLFRRTLPHWTGPAYMTLMPLAAVYVRRFISDGKSGRLMPGVLKWGAGFLLVVLSLALLQIHQGWILNKGIETGSGKRLGIKDITLDLYGWNQLQSGFSEIYRADTTSGRMNRKSVIISQRWFPAANLDYYVARPLGISLLTLAEIERTHKYAWITQTRGGFKPGMDAYFFSSGYDFADPVPLYSEYFETTDKPDTIPVFRNRKLVMYHYVWRMHNLINLPPASHDGRDVVLKK